MSVFIHAHGEREGRVVVSWTMINIYNYIHFFGFLLTWKKGENNWNGDVRELGRSKKDVTENIRFDIYIYIYIYICVCVCVCVCGLMYIYIYIYI